MSEKVYYLDGSAGCDLCDALTGYYPEDPGELHPHCNCPVEEVEIPTECNYELRELEVDDGIAQIDFEFEVDNCDSDSDAAIPVEIDEDEEEQFDDGVRELAESQGWQEPDVENLNGTAEISAHARMTVTATVERYVANMSAEMWVKHEDGTEEMVGTATGYYAKNINVLPGDETAEACGEGTSDDPEDPWDTDPDEPAPGDPDYPIG